MRPRTIVSSTPVALPFSRCPAKTYALANGEIRPGRSVVEHCQIVGEVAKALIQRYPEALGRALFPADAAFAAACHDIGKVSPTFVEKLGRACWANSNAWVGNG